MKKYNKGYSKKKQKEIGADIRELIGKDHSDYEIQETLNLQPHVLRHNKKQIYDKEGIFTYCNTCGSTKLRSSSYGDIEKSMAVCIPLQMLKIPVV